MDFSPRINFWCRLFYGVRKAPVWNRMHRHLCTRYKSQTLATVPLFEHTKILHALVKMGSAALAAAVEDSRDNLVVRGFESRRSGERTFFSRAKLWWWLLFRYPFHSRVSAVARKRSRSFCEKCRLQVTAKHACTLRMCLCMKWRDMVQFVWCTQNAPKRQHFHMAQRCRFTTSVVIKHIIKTSSLI